MSCPSTGISTRPRDDTAQTATMSYRAGPSHKITCKASDSPSSLRPVAFFVAPPPCHAYLLLPTLRHLPCSHTPTPSLHALLVSCCLVEWNYASSPSMCVLCRPLPAPTPSLCSMLDNNPRHHTCLLFVGGACSHSF